MSNSIWNEEIIAYERKGTLESHKVEVAVIGGGLTGILTAYLLQQQGKQVEVFEADTIGGGMTGNTTAKITSQHRLIYDRLITQYGMEKAKEYARRNEQAIAQYETLIQEKGIDCEFTRESAYVYTTKDTKNIKAEVEAAKKVGIDAYFTTETALPFPVTGAVCFPNQARFHPIKFLAAIAKELTIWEHAMVKRIKGNTLEVLDQTRGGELVEIEADKIVIATHYPMLNHPGYFFLRMYQERSYVVAVKQEKGLAHGMYIGEQEDDLSFRRSGEYILIGGENHRVGISGSKEHKKSLQYVAAGLYPDAPIVASWSNQDCMSLDQIPYIGRLSKRRNDRYVATGFSKWGMSTSMVAANMLTEYITGAMPIEDSIFSPSRFSYKASKKNGKDHIKTTIKGFFGFTGQPMAEKLYQIKKGDAGIVWHKGRRIGVYRDEEGKVHAVAARCTHLGCRLSWNKEEKTWDCPCHGSRFDYDGNLLTNPTKKALCRKEY